MTILLIFFQPFEMSFVCFIVLSFLNLNQGAKSLKKISICDCNFNYKEVAINTCDKKSISYINEVTSSVVNDNLLLCKHIPRG